jgi:hypothetical protein
MYELEIYLQDHMYGCKLHREVSVYILDTYLYHFSK